MTASNLKILWAVDPFAKDLTFQTTAGEVIQSLAERIETVVDPAYVDSKAKLDVPEEKLKELHADFAAKAQARLDQIVGRRKLGEQLPIRLLTTEQNSMRARAETLLQHGHATKADLIVASTHSRSGPAHWFLGSFVETLSLMSDLPLLVIHPQLDKKVAMDRILFPTDLSEASHDVFQKTLPLAISLQSKIVLFHKSAQELLPFNELAFSLYEITREAAEREFHEREKQIQGWAQEAQSAGVSAEVVIDRKPGETVAESIIQQSHDWPGMIMMAGASHEGEPCIMGNAARNVIRRASCPVWVMHSSACGEKLNALLRKAA